MEKQRDKAAKRVERKLAKEAGLTEPDSDIELDEFGVPVNQAGAPDEAGSPDEPGPDKVGPPDTSPKE
jgi:hypothetical protein